MKSVKYQDILGTLHHHRRGSRMVQLPKKISPETCIVCKGRLQCGLQHCPLLERMQNRQQLQMKLKDKNFDGTTPPSVFVSWNNYPNISIAPLSPTFISKSAGFLDNPEQWNGLPLEDIVGFREQLLRSATNVRANEASNPSYKVQDIQELAKAEKAFNVHVELEKIPLLEVEFSDTFAPIGPKGILKTMQFEENPRIPKKIEYLTSDSDAKSQTAMEELYFSNIPVHKIHNLLSAGTLGIQEKRKFVPTRWSITAVDDTLSEFLLEEVKNNPVLDSVQLFHAKQWGNDFYVLLLPRTWSFEQLEAWQPGTPWNVGQEAHISADFEFFDGRKNYADSVTGAYYASKLAVAEHLYGQKKQAACIIFRGVGPEYTIGLGVWVIRETVRKALQEEPLRFSDFKLAVSYIGTKFNIPISEWKKNSKLLDYFAHQKSLNEF
ncbi:MAG: Nre family DNA repair protein [Candidatus Diapherotrites archaeon]